MSYRFYCLSYKNDYRKYRMMGRFLRLNIEHFISEGVGPEDVRLQNFRRNCSCTHGHIDNLKRFINSDVEYGIFCEDDIYINKNLKDFIPKILKDYELLQVNVLLLGYLIYSNPNENNKIENFSNLNFSYYRYPDNLWGTQMFMMNKFWAKFLLNYLENHFDEDNPDLPFSADWTITKLGKRAMIYPMLAVEDGEKNYSDFGQQAAHKGTFNHNYKAEFFL